MFQPITFEFARQKRMAIWKRYRASRKGSRYKVGSRTSTTRRRVGAFGMLRGTKNVGMLRSVARRYGTRIPRALNPFPNTKLVRHKYVDNIALPAGIGPGSKVIWQFRANSMYDPDYTGVGHQPLFHDEMAAQYNYYTVLHSTCKLTFPAEQNTKQNMLLWVDDDLAYPSDANTAQEQHGTKPGIVLQRRYAPLHLKAKYNAAKWNRTTKAGLLADNDNKTASGTNPIQKSQKYYTMYISPVISTETLATQAMRVEMVFWTLWREPVDHVGS